MEKSINLTILTYFAPILVLTGILGFIIPPEYALMSGEPAYNYFHITFGVIGCFIAFVSKRDQFASFFNIIFGLIDLLQFISSYTKQFTYEYFLPKPADDILHIVIGLVLVVVGVVYKDKVSVKSHRPKEKKAHKSKFLL